MNLKPTCNHTIIQKCIMFSKNTKNIKFKYTI